MNNLAATDLHNLAKLLSFDDQDSSEEEIDFSSKAPITPVTIIQGEYQSDYTEHTIPQERKDQYEKLKISKNIWSQDEVFDEEYDESILKEKPDYDLVFQQDITPSDIYLQLGNKNPGSSGCENMILKVQLEEKISCEDIILKISINSILCKTKKYYLDLALPKAVDPRKCSAKWDLNNCILKIILPLDEDSKLNV